MITNCKGPIESIIIFLISSLGFLSITKHIISFTRWTLIYFLRPSKNLPVLYGPWAIITGSTDGIGKAIAFELAQKGLNLILVSRDPVKLAQVTQEIEERVPGRSVKSLVIDFSDEERFPDVGKVLEQFIEALEVGVVVNNVGVTYPKAMYFHEVEEEVWKRIVRVNLEGTTRVTIAVLKGMMKRRRGAIVNVSSGAGIVVPSHPLFAVYAATKALNPKRIGGDFKQGVQVHSGFLGAYDSAGTRFLFLIRQAIGYDYKYGIIYVTMYNFGSPIVGNRQFAEVYNEVISSTYINIIKPCLYKVLQYHLLMQELMWKMVLLEESWINCVQFATGRDLRPGQLREKLANKEKYQSTLLEVESINN